MNWDLKFSCPETQITIPRPHTMYVCNSYSYCAELGIETLRVRRELIARRFFHRILEPTSCLHHLIPPKRTVHKLRNLGNLCRIQFLLLDQRDFETLLFCTL